MTRNLARPALFLAVAVAHALLACGAPTRAAAPAPSPSGPGADSYLPVSEAELAEALRAPAITCVAASTASGCAADPDLHLDLHPGRPEPASAGPGVL